MNGQTATKTSFPKQKNRPIPWLSGGLALLIGLIIFAIQYPNLHSIDPSSSPPYTYVRPRPDLVLELALVTFIPSLIIVTFGRRWIIFEYLAWIILTMFICTTF